MTRNRAMVSTGVFALLCVTATAQDKEDRTLLTTEKIDLVRRLPGA